MVCFDWLSGHHMLSSAAQTSQAVAIPEQLFVARRISGVMLPNNGANNHSRAGNVLRRDRNFPTPVIAKRCS